MADLRVIILAAGKGTRMKSDLPKVLHALGGRPLVEHIIRTARALNPVETVLVVGHGAEEVRQALAAYEDLQYVVQTPQLGTGHAVQQAGPVLAGKRGTLLLLYGDVPLLQVSTLNRLIEQHRCTDAAATVLTTRLDDPYGYGRIVRDEAGSIAAIVEERDASEEQRVLHEVNSGIYVFELEPLFQELSRLAADNSQGEYYLTDLVRLYRQKGLRFETFSIDDPSELRGVNSRVDLAELGAVVRARKCRSLMHAGVTIEDPATTYIDEDVVVGADTTLAPGVVLSGETAVGARCRILSGSRLTNAIVGDDVQILDGCVIVESSVRAGASLGPFAHLRPGSEVGEGAHVGNFVELKKTRMGKGSKAGHLSYLGDAIIGERVNIGAGTITCNYDGIHKHTTVIEDGVFVGSDSQLIAPVTIGKDAYVAAGSSITADVPPGALAVARGRQQNKPEWAAARRAARKQESS